ncbi:hypothetical protein [Nonomuraea sp. SYSU D8015]|uniref:hypothetical protein n=1 Tax=Nonomuraea sp. SYSU D8015 TaxID=2593644 RepID=UPI001660A0F5|nr:hypothetical protein [Nonomuraea sp. SYSU D8015]
MLEDDEHVPVSAVVLEVQRQYDEDKRWSWPVYLATLRARHKCPVLLLGTSSRSWVRKAATATSVDELFD